MKTISLIIVTYNSSKHIFDCLESVFKHNDIGEELEVIVVDNNSQEREAMFEGIKNKFGDSVILKDSGKNGGYGYGNNIGVKMATAPVVIIMNPDVRIESPIFGRIIAKMDNDYSTGVLGVSFVDGSLPYYIKLEKINICNQIIHPLRVRLHKYNEKLMYMSGSFLVFRKEVFEKAGAFDENIFMYTEEPDITNRIQALGYKAIWCRDIKVRHLAHGRRFNKKTEDMMFESLKYYFKKYNADLAYNLTTKIKVCKFKKLVAKIIGNKQKIEDFEMRINYLNDCLRTLVS
jgi:Predicted glycosyltransferases